MPTPRGAVRVAWNIGDGALSLDVTVPANTRADILLPPGMRGGGVVESGRALDEAPGVAVRSREGARTVVEVGGGLYRFRYRHR